MGEIPKVALANSTCAATIPLLGFGTAAFPFTASENTKEAVLNAIKLGYRHFDAAAIYNSEQPLGDAVAEALRDGVIKSRSELFITSKLWCKDGHPHRVLPALQKTLKNLGMEYLDLYLIHFPMSLKCSELNDFPYDKSDILPMDFKGVWEAMEDCLKLGLTKHIGVSNFSVEKLQNLLSTAKIPPAVNQVEVNPLWHEKKLREFCEENGIHITAYSPLGARGTPWGANEVLDCEVLKQIAQSKGKSVAQVCLRWVYEQGVSVLVKSFNKERMKENLEIFDWTLSFEELEIINQIQQRKSCRAEECVSEKGPFKSVQEIWDMEIE